MVFLRFARKHSFTFFPGTCHLLCQLWGSLWRNGRRLLVLCFWYMRIPTLWAKPFSWIWFRLVPQRLSCTRIIRKGKLGLSGKSTSWFKELIETKPIPLIKSLIVGFKTHQTAPFISATKIRRSRHTNSTGFRVCSALALGKDIVGVKTFPTHSQELPGSTFIK